jgi:hypothetical protein
MLTQIVLLRGSCTAQVNSKARKAGSSHVNLWSLR